MSDALLDQDIRSWLADHAGRANAAPRAELLAYLRAQGHGVDDRAMRKAYANMDRLGSCSRGIFLIIDAEDRRISQRGLHAHAMASLVRERAIKDAAPCGQIELFGEEA